MFLMNQKKPVQAKRVGGSLIAAFRRSNPRLVWKFDLEKNHSFTCELQGEEGDLELGVTSPKGEFYPIARFASHEDADEAFTAVQRVLLKGGRVGWFLDLLKWVVGVVLVLAAVLFTLYLLIHTTNLQKPSAGSSASGPAIIQNGIPMPADQVLQPPP